MIIENYTIIRWVILWGIIAIMANATGTNLGTIFAGLAAAFSGLGLLFGLYKWCRRKCKLRNPFEVKYDPPRTARYEAYPNTREQDLKLQIKVEVDVKSIELEFSPQNESTPRIHELYDPDDTFKGIPESVSINHAMHSIEWRYNNISHQRVDSIIKIGMRYIADKPFNGELLVRLTVAECTREKSLPFPIS